MYRYFVEKPDMVELKEQVTKYTGVEQKRVKRLYDILGDTIISKEFIEGFLSYFDSGETKRESLPLTKESLTSLHELFRVHSQLGSKGIELIMGEYVKDMFDEIQPLKFFDGMTLSEMDYSFDRFMDFLKIEGAKSDIPYIKEEQKISFLLEYGRDFVEYIKKFVIKYHKTFEDIYYSIPDASVVRKDADVFYDIGSKELFGPSGYPYSYQMCRDMILHGEIDDYKHPLIYRSSIIGRFESPMTTEEFLKSIEEKRKKIKIRKK